jgi:hypothetical protein
MDRQHKSMKHSLTMAFKIICILLIMTGLNCRRDDDAWNQLLISNQMQDTLILQATKKYLSPIPGPQHVLLSKSIHNLASSLHNSDLDMIRENWGNQGDTIEIYNKGVLVIKWGGPLRNMDTNINHFFNEQSWIITKGGRKNKYTIATFTISESDLGNIEGK